MEKIIRRVNIELSHFKQLTDHCRKLFMSIALYNVTDPLLWTFVSAFLWREYQSVNVVAWYNFSAFIGLPLGFYVNGLLLNRFHHKDLYLFGSILQGLIVTILLFTGHMPVIMVLIFGILFGFGSGFFWANRIFLAIHTTANSNRIYFASLDTITSNIAKIVVPLLVGWFIVLGSRINLYSEQTAYQILAILLMILLFVTGYIINSVTIEQRPIKRVLLYHPSQLWQRFRLFTAIGGIYGGIAIFLSVLMVLKFVGNEASLGTIQSAAAGISTLAVYVVARKAQTKHRIYIMAIGILLAVAAALSFGVLYSSLGVVLYYIFNAPSFPFRWISEAPLGYDIIDHEEKNHDNHPYSYIVDQEFFVNLGRNIAILAFLIVSVFSLDIALRFSLITVALIQVIRLVLARGFEKQLMLSRKELEKKIDIETAEEYLK